MFYKILPANMKSYGYQYQVGVNRMENPEKLGETMLSEFEPGDTYEAGLYFANADNILAHAHHGDIIAQVEIAEGATLECWGGGEYSTDALEILSVRPLWETRTLKELAQEGVDLSVDDNAILFWAKELHPEKADVIAYLEETLNA